MSSQLLKNLQDSKFSRWISHLDPYLSFSLSFMSHFFNSAKHLDCEKSKVHTFSFTLFEIRYTIETCRYLKQQRITPCCLKGFQTVLMRIVMSKVVLCRSVSIMQASFRPLCPPFDRICDRCNTTAIYFTIPLSCVEVVGAVPVPHSLVAGHVERRAWESCCTKSTL